MSCAEPIGDARAGHEFFGHPKGLAVLFVVELWERFSFYGMRALLIIYLTTVVLVQRPQDMIGFGPLARLLGFDAAHAGNAEWQAFASHIYGLYSGFVYFTPLIGGWLADRWFGKKSVIVVGGLLVAIGHLILPTVVLAMSSYASWSRFQRSSMLDVLNSDYLRLAKAKGLSRRKVMVRHGLRTALIPLTTQVTLDVAAILGGAVLTETVFGWQGMGSMLINGINNQDTNVILAWLVVSAIIVIAFNLIADLLYAVLDPRIRLA